MNIKIKDKEKFNGKFSIYWKQKEPDIFRYLRNNLKEVDDDDRNDVFSNICTKLYKSLSTGKYPDEKWDMLLGKIKKGCRNDFLREQYKRVKKISERKEDDLEKISLIKEQEESETEYLERVAGLPRDKKTKYDNLPFLRGILLSPHRSLQEMMLVWLASSRGRLRNVIAEKFPFIGRRVRQRGLNFEVRRKFKNEKKNDIPFTEEEHDEISRFYSILFKLVERLGLNDEIGINALKILLISENPFFDWYNLSGSSKTKHYFSFDEKSNLVLKKTIKRPYPNFFRDYLVLVGPKGIRDLREFLQEYQETKYPDYPVDEEHSKKWFKIGKLSNAAMNKQKFGRKGKPGFKRKVEKYDLILKDVIENL